MKKTVDIARLHTLLDRGAAITAAANHARAQASEAATDARAQPGNQALQERATRLQSRSSDEARRANLWTVYCKDLRATAAQHGVHV